MNPLETQAVQRAFNAGHFFNTGKADIKSTDLGNLTVADPDVISALRSLSKSEAVVYEQAVRAVHDRDAEFDGIVGPAFSTLLKTPRCSVPDIAPPKGAKFHFADPFLQEVVKRMQDEQDIAKAAGSGNWSRCHGVGNFHASVVRVKTQGIPSFLKPHFTTILKRVRKAYADIGLLFHFIDEGKTDLITGKSWKSSVNIEFSFVGRSDGWIGLAILGYRQSCSDNIWCRYLSTYRGGHNDSAIIAQWTSLIKHELGHNCGLDHTRGGVMNPSIVSNLRPEWSSDDPSTRTLKKKFGGNPVPTDDEPPQPPPKTDLQKLEKRIDELETKQLALEGVNAYVLQRISDIEGQI